jgi:hypothetical protein
MARRTPTMPISPTQLKHFAAATVALTALLALFASGEETGIAAQVKATQAKNDLVVAEQEKLGTKKIAANLKVRNTGGFGADEGGDGGFASGGSAGGGSYSAPAARPASKAQRSPEMLLPPRPGETRMPTKPSAAPRKKPQAEPTKREEDEMLAASRARSSGSSE